MPNETAHNPMTGSGLRREAIDEVTAAKMALLNLRREPRDPTSLIRKHPLATTGAAFLLGMWIVKSSTVRTLGRAGLVLGMRGAIARAIREVL